MSIINQLLKDLQKRHAAEPVAGISPQARPVPYTTRRSFLIPVLVGVVVVALAIGAAYLRSGPGLGQRTILGSVPVAPAVAPAPAAPVPASSPGLPAESVVEAALLVPVFQLSDELRVLPEDRPAVKQTAPKTLESEPTRRPARTQSPPTPKPVPAVQDAAATGASAPASVPAPEPLVVPPVSQPPASGRPVPEPTEEVLIATDLPSPPIEKQTRQLTSYERAENDFRVGVAELRRGRLGDAEAKFRAAIREDRSHLSAQQALIGLLIDSGRNADAEIVLSEALSSNPRQPRHAMVLARLELERGDAQGAVTTLESVKPYAGVDADYFSFLAAALQRVSRHDEAVAYYRNALALAPGNAVWMMGMGISLRASNQLADAQDAFRRAAQTRTLNPDLQAFVEKQLAELQATKP